MFKPIHSKTMSLVGMLKQYATGVSNDATERVFSPLKKNGGDRMHEFAPNSNEKRTRRRSEIGSG
jgi:hypothetical protein